MAAHLPLYKRIVEREGQYCVTSADGSQTLGCHATLAEAQAQLGAVEANKSRIRKVDLTRSLVFGFASVATDGEGQPIVDYQGDVIAPEDLEAAAYGFVHKRHGEGAGGEQHEGEASAGLIESMVWTPAKTEAFFLGTDPLVTSTVVADLRKAETPAAAVAVLAKAIGTRWWIGQRVPAETLAKVKDGRLPMFSIEGSAVEEAEADAAAA